LQPVEECPQDFERIEDVIWRQELKTISASFAAAAGPEVEAVNGRQSFVPPALYIARSLVLPRRSWRMPEGLFRTPAR
jgi:hypothetical protein